MTNGAQVGITTPFNIISDSFLSTYMSTIFQEIVVLSTEFSDIRKNVKYFYSNKKS